MEIFRIGLENSLLILKVNSELAMILHDEYYEWLNYSPDPSDVAYTSKIIRSLNQLGEEYELLLNAQQVDSFKVFLDSEEATTDLSKHFRESFLEKNYLLIGEEFPIVRRIRTSEQTGTI